MPKKLLNVLSFSLSLVPARAGCSLPAIVRPRSLKIEALNFIVLLLLGLSVVKIETMTKKRKREVIFSVHLNSSHLLVKARSNEKVFLHSIHTIIVWQIQGFSSTGGFCWT